MTPRTFSGADVAAVAEALLEAAERGDDQYALAETCFRLGRLGFARSDHEAARAAYERALDLYMTISEPYSIGVIQRRLARMTGDRSKRCEHVKHAHAAWSSIDRDDLIERLAREFEDCA